MRWLGASLLYHCVVLSELGESPLYEERIVVLSAEEESAARTAAELAGKEGTHAYRNADGDRVEWVFVGVVDVKELFDEHLSHGTEVFYRHLSASQAEVFASSGI